LRLARWCFLRQRAALKPFFKDLESEFWARQTLCLLRTPSTPQSLTFPRSRSELAAEYFERLESPYQELVWFEDSARAPPFEEPEKFNAEIVRIAREIGLLQGD
jgi:hypothetical protein